MHPYDAAYHPGLRQQVERQQGFYYGQQQQRAQHAGGETGAGAAAAHRQYATIGGTVAGTVGGGPRDPRAQRRQAAPQPQHRAVQRVAVLDSRAFSPLGAGALSWGEQQQLRERQQRQAAGGVVTAATAQHHYRTIG